MGVPVHYGSGASEVIREVVTNPTGRYKITSDSLRHGDVERALMEWRSLIRHIAAAPDLEWERWRALKSAARRIARPDRLARPSSISRRSSPRNSVAFDALDEARLSPELPILRPNPAHTLAPTLSPLC